MILQIKCCIFQVILLFHNNMKDKRQTELKQRQRTWSSNRPHMSNSSSKSTWEIKIKAAPPKLSVEGNHFSAELIFSRGVCLPHGLAAWLAPDQSACALREADTAVIQVRGAHSLD